MNMRTDTIAGNKHQAVASRANYSTRYWLGRDDARRCTVAPIEVDN